MKDSQRRWKQNSGDSVMSMLMGLDEQCPQQPFHERRRVLSESYVRKVASICLRPGSLVSIGSSTNNESGHGDNGVPEVGISKGKNESVLDECMSLSTSNVRKGVKISKSLTEASSEERKSIGKKGKHCATRHVLRYKQKLDHDLVAGHIGVLGIDSVNNSSTSQLETIDKPHLLSSSISALEPKSEKVVFELEDAKLNVHSRARYRVYGKSAMPRSGKTPHEFTCKELFVNNIVPPRHSCIACVRNMKRIFQRERQRSKFEEVSKPGYKNCSHDPHLLLDQSSLADNSRKQYFERRKTAKGVQKFEVSGRNQTLNMFALADKKSMPKISDMRLGRSGLCSPSSLQSRSSDSSSPSGISSTDVWDDDCRKSSQASEFEAMKEILSTGSNLKQHKSTARDNMSKEQTASQTNTLESKDGRGSEQLQSPLGVDDTMSPISKVSVLSSCYFSCFGSSYNNPEAYIQSIRNEIDSCPENDNCEKIERNQRNSKSISNLTAQNIYDASYASAEAFSAGDCSRINDEPQLQSHHGSLSEEGGHTSIVEEIFSREASLNESTEGESAYSNCSGTGAPESIENLKRTNQHSPDSVLELLDIKHPSSFECLDCKGLLLQLQALNNESEETCSEGSVMVVSGDEDFEEQFGDLTHDGRKVKRWLGDVESWNFSYLVDVLDEAGFYDMHSFMDFKIWHSLECPVSPLVFEALEKKYGKQTSWQKSERKLLFDRINSGLVGIFNPVINFHASATPIGRRFCSSFRRDELEDELWMMLISQEKEKSKNLYEKALEKWLEAEEGTDIICRELETSLLDELVMELASMWN